MPSAFLRYQFQIKLHSIVYMFKDEHTSYTLLFNTIYMYVLMMMCVGGARPGQLDVSK